MTALEPKIARRLYGYHSGKRRVITMQSNTTWISRIGDFISWLEYKLTRALG